MPPRIHTLWTRIAQFLLSLWHQVVIVISNAGVKFYAGLKKAWNQILKSVRDYLALLKGFVFKIWGEAIFAILILVMILINNQFIQQLSHDDQNLLQNFIEWYAVVYTLVLSVIVGQGWRKYNKINNEIDREADSLVLLVQTGRMFHHEKLSQALFLAVKRYAICLRLLQANDSRTKNETHEKMKDIRECVILLIKSESDDCLKSELLHQYNEAYDARGDRFDLIEQKLPPHTWVIFIVASLIWLWGFLWLKFDSVYFKFYLLGATILSISYLFYLARDLDDPTTGNWKMKFSSFETHIF